MSPYIPFNFEQEAEEVEGMPALNCRQDDVPMVDTLVPGETEGVWKRKRECPICHGRQYAMMSDALPMPALLEGPKWVGELPRATAYNPTCEPNEPPRYPDTSGVDYTTGIMNFGDAVTKINDRINDFYKDMDKKVPRTPRVSSVTMLQPSVPTGMATVSAPGLRIVKGRWVDVRHNGMKCPRCDGVFDKLYTTDDDNWKELICAGCKQEIAEANAAAMQLDAKCFELGE